MNADLNQLVQQYLAGPRMLRRSVYGMDADQLRARPVPGRWSTLEVVCHIVDFEPILADRMKRIIALDNPLLLAADENRFAERLCYHDRDVAEELVLLEATRSQMARILLKLRPEDLQRTGTHSEKGPRTLQQVLTSAIEHIPHHVRFIEEKRRALGLPV